MGQVTHRRLYFLALLVELLADATDHDGDHGQDGQHDRSEFPVHPEEVAEQESDGQSLANDDLDGIGRSARHHSDVIGDAGDQVAGTLLVKISIGQP